MVSTFGELFKQRRIALKKTLREFCSENGLDSGNISKIERGKLPAPSSDKKLNEYAACLKIKSGKDDWQEFKDLAALSAGKIPKDLKDEELLARLPVFFRAIKDRKFTAEELNELIEKIKES